MLIFVKIIYIFLVKIKKINILIVPIYLIKCIHTYLYKLLLSQILCID